MGKVGLQDEKGYKYHRGESESINGGEGLLRHFLACVEIIVAAYPKYA